MKYLIFLTALALTLTSCEEDSEFLDYLANANNNTIGGCTDPIACNYEEPQSNNGNYCDYSCLGCNDPAACNYLPDFSENNDGCLYLSSCDKTYVPDDKFEAYLEREEYGVGNPNNTHGDMISNNNYVYTELLTQESLIIASWIPGTVGISDLTGLEDFSSLKLLTIQGSSLSNLDLKNGLNHILTSLSISDCPNLSCVQVDNSTWSTNNWANVDSQIYFSEDCQ
ncbi:hypothetical protein N9I30_02540 [Flavobacteriales bacterium]|jgi:hypothetical protein|nr:hypothetical protein [Flavobacteriales bacterium]